METSAFLQKALIHGVDFELKFARAGTDAGREQHRFAGLERHTVAGEGVKRLRIEIEIEGELHRFPDRIFEDRPRSAGKLTVAAAGETFVFYLKFYHGVSFVDVRGSSFL